MHVDGHGALRLTAVLPDERSCENVPETITNHNQGSIFLPAEQVRYASLQEQNDDGCGDRKNYKQKKRWECTNATCCDCQERKEIDDLGNANGRPTEPPQFSKDRIEINNPSTSIGAFDGELCHA
jgi:hypothetical protein